MSMGPKPVNFLESYEFRRESGQFFGRVDGFRREMKNSRQFKPEGRMALRAATTLRAGSREMLRGHGGIRYPLCTAKDVQIFPARLFLNEGGCAGEVIIRLATFGKAACCER